MWLLAGYGEGGAMHGRVRQAGQSGQEIGVSGATGEQDGGGSLEGLKIVCSS